MVKENLWKLPFICIVYILFIASFTGIQAQVKIGDNPNTIDANSILELESTAKGILIPRVSLTNLNNESPLTATVPAGMLVYSSGGSVTDGFYYWTGVKWAAIASSDNIRDDFYLIKSESDFPAPVSGVISLNAGSVYEINGSVNVANMIDLNGSYLIGKNANADKLVYTGSGELFTGNNGGTIRLLTLTSGPGKLFNIDASSNPGQSLLIRDCIISSCTNVGTVKGFTIFFSDIISFQSNTNGITFEDITYLLLSNTAWFPNNQGTFERMTGSFNNIIKLGGFMQPLASAGATAIDITGISSITGTAELKNTSFIGDGTYINGTFSKTWEVEGGGIETQKDEVATGDLFISSSSATIISSVNVPVKVAGSTVSSFLFRVTAPSNNRLEYDGTRARKFKASANISFTTSSNNQDISFYFAKNGSVLNSTRSQRKTGSSGDIGSIGISGIIELSDGDYVEVWTANNSSTSNITVQYMNFSIK